MKFIKLLTVIVFSVAVTLGCQAQQKEDAKVISPEEAKVAMAAEEELILIDVRTRKEFEAGNIPGANNIDFFDDKFLEQMRQYDKEKPIYLYCRSGNRSSKAAKQLQELGFKKIYDIEGGFLNWKE